MGCAVIDICDNRELHVCHITFSIFKFDTIQFVNLRCIMKEGVELSELWELNNSNKPAKAWSEARPLPPSWVHIVTNQFILLVMKNFKLAVSSVTLYLLIH